MIAAIAWRNIWRNRLRSSIVIAAIALGLFGGLFSIAFMEGLADQTLKTAISQYLSHIQLHHPLFPDNEELMYRISDADSLVKQLTCVPVVAAAARRYRIRAMASTANGNAGVEILGIDPEIERTITTIHEKIVAGGYFNEARRNPIVIGGRLAEKLKVGPGRKIVLTAQAEDGTLIGGAFRIAGLYHTGNSLIEESQVYALNRDLSRLLELPEEESHEIALLLKDPDQLTAASGLLAARFPELKVETWREIAPELGVLQGYMQQMMFLFLVIVLIALAFGIVNTMLMAIVERTRELGLLMALGMKRMRIFVMIMLETVFLSLTGGATGMAVTAAAIRFTSPHGIDLSYFGEGLSAMGYAARICPQLDEIYYLALTIMVILTAIHASIFPARRALRLQPAEAVRIE